MYQWIMLGITVIILGVLIVRKPFWLVPFLGVALALEISVTWYPQFEITNWTLEPVTLALLTSVAIILAVLVRLIIFQELRRKIVVVLKDPLTVILVLFLILGAASVFYSVDSGKTINETGKLAYLIILFVSIALLSSKEKALLPLHAVHFTALALAPLAFYEGFLGRAIWETANLPADVLGINVTFSNPAAFARYIILAIAANFVIQLFARDKGTKMICMGALAVLLAELALTFSPAGILTLFIVLIIALIIIPERAAILWVLGLGLFGGGLVLFIRPDIWESLLKVVQSFAATNPFAQATLAIFGGNFLLGGGFGTLETTQPSGPIFTIAAELGILGLGLFVALWAALIIRLFALYYRSSDFLSMFSNNNNEYFVGIAYFLWALTILVISHFEGRFFADPTFWLSCALLVVLNLNLEYNIRMY
ncbi:MAG TPA: polymerase [Peptococcaceae bacterium]|nr:polymerase [Peptococcaceae bacterium]